jgi:hypothetical protein
LSCLSHKDETGQQDRLKRHLCSQQSEGLRIEVMGRCKGRDIPEDPACKQRQVQADETQAPGKAGNTIAWALGGTSLGEELLLMNCRNLIRFR